MLKKKKVIGIVATVVAFAVAFTAGYFLSGDIFSDKATSTDAENTGTTSADNSYIPENEIMGSGKLKIGQAEYLYYCASIFDSLCSASFQYDYYYGEGQGANFTGYDYKKSPAEQLYQGDEDVGGMVQPTYLDYIEFMAKKQLHTTKAYVNYAKLNNIKLSDTEKAEIDTAIANAHESVKELDMTLDEYLKKYFGDGMTEDIFRSVMEDQYIVNKIDKLKSEAFGKKYTDEVLEKIYSENTLKYGVVTLRDYGFAAETEKKEDGTSVIKEGAMEKAKALAEDFAAKVKDETSFKELAAAAEKAKGNEKSEQFVSDDAYTLLENKDAATLEQESGDHEFTVWAFSADRRNGEVKVVEIAEYGYVVYMISEPVHKIATTYTYDVRHVLFQFAEDGSTTEGEIKLLDTDKYDVNIDIDVDPAEAKDPGLYMKAQNALIEYLEGDKTEESFGELAKKYSADGNAAQGGLYTAVTEGYMVAPFESWSLAEGRQPGDVGIVETEYGYHIMYHVKKDEATSWKGVIRENSIYEDVLSFTETLTAGYESEVDGYKDGYAQTVRESIDKLVKQNLEYYNQIIDEQLNNLTTTQN